MSGLSDKDIGREMNAGLTVDPFIMDNLKPNSYDVTLGQDFLWIDEERLDKIWDCTVIDPFDLPQDLYSTHRVGPHSAYCLAPRQFVLASTVETITLKNHICARIEGKSSLARLGIAVHMTAGFIDAGWSGKITLELFNFSPIAVLLRPGMKIAQIFFQYLNTPAMVPYGNHPNSKYQGATGVEGSRYDSNPAPA